MENKIERLLRKLYGRAASWTHNYWEPAKGRNVRKLSHRLGRRFADWLTQRLWRAYTVIGNPQWRRDLHKRLHNFSKPL